MKFYNKESGDYNYFKIFLAVFLAIVSSVVVYFLFSKISIILSFFSKILSILSPIIVGIIFACLLNPIVKKFENLYNKKDKIKKKKKLGRILGILSTYLILLVFVILICVFLLPNLFESINQMIVNFPTYLENIFGFIRKLCTKFNINPKFLDDYNTDLSALVKTNVLPNLDIIINNLASGITSVVRGIINVVVSIIISSYLIYDRELFINGIAKLLKAYCSTKVYTEIKRVVENVYKVFCGFMIAKLIDSLIIGIITFIILSIFRIPYTLLISIVIGITNIIPFFGPFIGAIPSIVLLLIIDPTKALEFAVIIFLIQQFDGNILGPKLIGNKLGMKSFWVLFAIILFGGLFGFAGMLFGVPFFACIYEFLKNLTEKKFKNRMEKIEESES